MSHLLHKLTLPVAMLALSASASLAADFYAGKTISIITSTGSGGSYAAAARAVADHMPQYIPGKPNMVVKNMPGGGHTRATNFLYNNAPKDGTVIGTVVHTVPMHQVVDGRGVRFNASKFEWIGAAGVSNLTVVVNASAGVKTLADVLNKEVTVGATGTGSGTYLYPNALNKILGTKFKIVVGYRKGREIDLAMERGEVNGRGGASYGSVVASHEAKLKAGKLLVIAQIGYKRDPLLANVPLLQEMTEDKDKKEILRFISAPVNLGRPYMAPPETPKDRVAILRKAFEATMKDKGFLDQAKKLKLDLAPTNAAQVQKIVDETVKAPAAIIAKVKAAIRPSAEDVAEAKRKRARKKKKSKK